MLTIKFNDREKEMWLQRAAQSRLPSRQPKPKSRKRRRPRKKEPASSSKQKKERGLTQFRNTAVGHLLYVYAPVQYCLLMEWQRAATGWQRSQRISYYSIEAIAAASSNPLFRLSKFRRAMIAYRRFGLRPEKKAEWTLRDAVYYAKNSYRIHETFKRCSGE